MYYRQLSTITIACAFLFSCQSGKQEVSEDALSTFGPYVYALDTLQLTQNLAQVLKADTSRWAADKTVRKYYQDKDHFEETPLWFTRMGVSSEADSLLSYLRREAPRNGLDTMAFFVPQIADDLSIVRSLAFDSLGVSINEVLPRLDYHLSKAYVRYTAGQHFGFARPDRLLNRLNMKADSSGYAHLFDYEVKAPDYEEVMHKLLSDDRHDYLLASQPTSHVYKSLQFRLEASTNADERRKLALNMERSRWQVNQPEPQDRMVIVNLPAQQLWATSPDSVLNMRICCGATTTKTPLLISQISHVQVNPEWVIPFNIVKTDVARHGGDSAYFARNRYDIIDRTTNDTLNPVHVSSDQLLSGRLRVSQKGGAGNSLGRIVFRFQNNFSVYLHDTNNHAAFKRERRLLSHGCIRVEYPFELARFLMPDMDERTLDQLRVSMDIEPETDEYKEYLEEHAEDPQPHRLISYRKVSPAVPVYLIYYTAYPNPETGAIELWPDYYGYDAAISREIGQFLLKK